jgi:hypothetical protein
VTYPSGDAFVLADQVQVRVDERQVREGLGEGSQGASRCAVRSPARTAAAGWHRSAASRAAPWGAARLPDLGERRHEARSCRIECTSVMSGLGGAPAALPGIDAGRCRRRAGRGSGRCGGTAGPRSGRPGRGGVGPFAWVPADLGYRGREARRSSIWRASPSAGVARRPPGEWRRA